MSADQDKPKPSRLGASLYSLAEMVNLSVGFGLITSSAVVMFFGKLLLAVVLAGFALGAFLRFKRGRAARLAKAD